MAGTRANRRVQKELEKFMADSVSDGLQIEVKSESIWNVKFSAAAGTIYEGENYTLEVTCKRCSYHKSYQQQWNTLTYTNNICEPTSNKL